MSVCLGARTTRAPRGVTKSPLASHVRRAEKVVTSGARGSASKWFYRGGKGGSLQNKRGVEVKASSSESQNSSGSEEEDDKVEKNDQKEEQKTTKEGGTYFFTLDSREYAELSESMRLIESETKRLKQEYNKIIVRAMQTPKDCIAWNERNGFDEKGKRLAEKQPKGKKWTRRSDGEASGSGGEGEGQQQGTEAQKRKEELDERLRKADEFLRQMMNESSILPEGFIQKMSKVLGDQNKLFSSFEEIFEKQLGEEMYEKYIEEKRQKAADENSSKIGNTALVNLKCVEEICPLFVLVFHHGQNSPEPAGIYSLQEKATPEELPVDTILAFMTREDAERYAKLLTSSLGTVPIVESVTKSELALTCRVGGHRCVVSNKGYELSPPKESLRVTDWERSNMLRSGAWRMVGEDESCAVSEDDLELDWKTHGMELMASYREEAKRKRLEDVRERLEQLYRKGTLGKNNEEDNNDPDDHSK